MYNFIIVAIIASVVVVADAATVVANYLKIKKIGIFDNIKGLFPFAFKFCFCKI